MIACLRRWFGLPRFRIALLDLEGKHCFGDLALKGGVIAQDAELDELLCDGGGPLHRVAGFEIDQRRPCDAGRIDAGLLVEVAIFDRDDGIRQDRAHRGQGFVVMLVARGMEVSDLRRTVAGQHDRVGRNVGSDLRDVWKLGSVGHVRRRGHDKNRHHDGEQSRPEGKLARPGLGQLQPHGLVRYHEEKKRPTRADY